jgi:hypothetical protein
MARHIGIVQIHSLGTGALASVGTGSAITGYITPVFQTLRIVHDAQVDRLRGVSGLIIGVMGVDDVIECTFDMIPAGTTAANALEAASLPAAPAAFSTSNLPIIECGGLTDALNTGAGTPWIYEGGGTINAPVDGKWSMTVTLRRYSGISTTTVITG